MTKSLEHKDKIEEMAKTTECAKGFSCLKSGFKKIPEVRLLAGSEVVECLEADGKTCKFGLCYGAGVFCECPLRKYIASNCRRQESRSANADLEGGHCEA